MQHCDGNCKVYVTPEEQILQDAVSQVYITYVHMRAALRLIVKTCDMHVRPRLHRGTGVRFVREGAIYISNMTCPVLPRNLTLCDPIAASSCS